MAHVHVKKNKRLMGDTRSEQQKNMEKGGWSAGMTGEQAERSAYLEKKLGLRWMPAVMLDNAHKVPVDGPPQTPTEKYMAKRKSAGRDGLAR
jgi:hypothetical protein